MRFSIRHVGEVCILTGSGQLTLGSGEAFFRSFRKELEDGARWFVFDLHRVPYIDSCSIGELVACQKRARNRSGIIRLVLNHRAQDMFTFLSLQAVFGHFYKDVEEALGSFLHRPESQPAASGPLAGPARRKPCTSSR